MKTISLEIPDNLYKKINALAKKWGKSDVSLLKQESHSCLDLVSDLVGSIEEPGDLSHNPEHLKNFGRKRPHFFTNKQYQF